MACQLTEDCPNTVRPFTLRHSFSEIFRRFSRKIWKRFDYIFGILTLNGNKKAQRRDDTRIGDELKKYCSDGFKAKKARISRNLLTQLKLPGGDP